MGRVWAMNYNPQVMSRAVEKSEGAREALIDGLIESDDPIPGQAESFRERAERVGFTREALANTRRFVETQGHDQAPTLKRGVAGPAMVRGETFQLTDEHTNAHGERVLEGYRQNGPLFERVLIHESQAAPHTRVVTRVRGH